MNLTNLKIKSKIENNKDIKKIFKLRVANLPSVVPLMWTLLFI